MLKSSPNDYDALRQGRMAKITGGCFRIKLSLGLGQKVKLNSCPWPGWARKSIGGTCVVGFVLVRGLRGGLASEASQGCSGVNKHVYFGLCLFLKGVCEVPELSHTSYKVRPLMARCLCLTFVL